MKELREYSWYELTKIWYTQTVSTAFCNDGKTCAMGPNIIIKRNRAVAGESSFHRHVAGRPSSEEASMCWIGTHIDRIGDWFMDYCANKLTHGVNGVPDKNWSLNRYVKEITSSSFVPTRLRFLFNYSTAVTVAVFFRKGLYNDPAWMGRKRIYRAWGLTVKR